MFKNLTLLTYWNNTRINEIINNSLCFCCCFYSQSSNKYKTVRLSCRFITHSINIQDELIDIDLYDNDITGLSYFFYFINIIDNNDNNCILFHKCVCFTTDYASNMRGQYNRLRTLIKNKIKNIKSIFFVSIYCFPHHHNLSVE